MIYDKHHLQVGCHADVFLQRRRDVVAVICQEKQTESGKGHHLHDKVDATHLIHELHAICEQNTTTSLDLITLEKLRPFILAGLTLSLKSSEHVLLLLCNLGIFRCAIIHVAEHLKGFFVLTHLVQVARGLGDTKDNENHNLCSSAQRGVSFSHRKITYNGKDDLACNW